MELFIFRHGEAGKRLSSAIDDKSRSLTSTGKAELLLEAKALKRIGIKFNVIVTSPLKRAYETATILASIYKAKKILKVWNELAPEGSVADVYKKLSQLGPESSILMVGHEPQLTEITKGIIHKDKAASCNIVLKKAGLLRIYISKSNPSLKGELRWLLSPRIIKALAKNSPQ
jgi:phosphohistidine phosphatase